MKYYMTVDQDDIIWGIGLTKKESRENAFDSKNMYIYNTGHYEKIIFKPSIECSKKTFDYVLTEDVGKNTKWKIIDDKAELTSKRRNPPIKIYD